MIKHSTQECATPWGDSIKKDEPKTKLTNNKHKWVNPSVGGKYGGWVVYKVGDWNKHTPLYHLQKHFFKKNRV